MKGFMGEWEKSSLLLPLQGSPPDLQGKGLEVLEVSSIRGPADSCWSGCCWSRSGSGTCKTHWRLTREKRFPAQLICEWRGEMYPAGCRDAWRGKTPDASKGRASPWPGQCSDCRRMGHRRATGGEDHVRLASRTLLVCGPGCLAALAVAAGLLLYCV
jgi:hypothetical protein